MQWFTLSPQALERIRGVTQSLRSRLGAQKIPENVRRLSDAELGKFVNDVLALIDESEAILGRVREQTPSRGLPRPFDPPAKGK